MTSRFIFKTTALYVLESIHDSWQGLCVHQSIVSSYDQSSRYWNLKLVSLWKCTFKCFWKHQSYFISVFCQHREMKWNLWQGWKGKRYWYFIFSFCSFSVQLCNFQSTAVFYWSRWYLFQEYFKRSREEKKAEKQSTEESEPSATKGSCIAS